MRYRPAIPETLLPPDDDEKRFIAQQLRALADPYAPEVVTTRFLSRRETVLLELALRRGDLGSDAWAHRVHFWGGHPDPSRAVAGMWPEFYDDDEITRSLTYDTPSIYDPLAYLRVTARGASPTDLAHKDYLGSLMGLGIERWHTGDLLLWTQDDEVGADLILTPTILPLLEREWLQVGRFSLQTTQLPGAADLRLPVSDDRTVRITVTQERLDSLIASAFRMSRSQAQTQIEQGFVQVNGSVSLKVDQRLSAGDVLTCGKLGRITLLEIIGNSRKGRLIYEIRVQQ